MDQNIHENHVLRIIILNSAVLTDISVMVILREKLKSLVPNLFLIFWKGHKKVLSLFLTSCCLISLF